MKTILMHHPHRAVNGRGFTLIEVMVTVAIVVILASVALPQYKDYVTRSKIPDATSRLASLQVQLEQYYQDNRKYDGATACSTDAGTSKYYTFSCASASASGYVLQAVGKDSMASFTYKVDQANNKSTVITAGPSGWTGSTTCWITNKGGVC